MEQYLIDLTEAKANPMSLELDFKVGSIMEQQHDCEFFGSYMVEKKVVKVTYNEYHKKKFVFVKDLLQEKNKTSKGVDKDLLNKQLKNLQKLLPKNITLKAEGKQRELTKQEISVIKSYFAFYNVVKYIPQRGMMLPNISDKGYVDFAFMNIPYEEDGKCYIYINLK